MSSRSPQGLDDLPPRCVRSLAASRLDELAQWARGAGHQFVDVDLSTAADKKAVLQVIGRALQFPGWYGANLDALYDCLTDLPEREGVAGWVIALHPLTAGAALDAEQRDALLDVFRDALETFEDAALPFRVLYVG